MLQLSQVTSHNTISVKQTPLDANSSIWDIVTEGVHNVMLTEPKSTNRDKIGTDWRLQMECLGGLGIHKLFLSVIHVNVGTKLE